MGRNAVVIIPAYLYFGNCGKRSLYMYMSALSSLC